jgi:hypothetical protein
MVTVLVITAVLLFIALFGGALVDWGFDYSLKRRMERAVRKHRIQR